MHCLAVSCVDLNVIGSIFVGEMGHFVGPVGFNVGLGFHPLLCIGRER